MSRAAPIVVICKGIGERGMNEVDVIPTTIAGVALLASIVVYFLNRRYASSLFKATEYPDIDFALEVLTSGKAIKSGRINMVEDFLPHLTWIEVLWHNKTKVEAVNLNAIITLARGLRRLQWESQEEDWARIAPLQQGKGMIGMEMNEVLATLCPESLVLKKENSAEVLDEWLEVRSGKKPPRFSLVVELRWRPPIWRGKLLKKESKAILKPQMGTDDRVESWTTERKSGIIALSLLKWRPKNLHLEV